MLETVSIPRERMPVLVGKGGSVKERIEKETGTALGITDTVSITGPDPLLVLRARDIVRAIGRGFSPETALRLAEEGCELHVVSLEGESLKKRKRLFGRVIGKDGRSRKRIERETGASICVRGKTLSLIGTREEIGPAEEAVGELLAGKSHPHAYKRMDIRKARP